MSIESFLEAARDQLGNDIAYIVDDNFKVDVDIIPTGVGGIDEATGIGGLPRGRITEIYGKEAAGKTTLCIHAMAEAQRLGLNVGFVDVEHAVSFERMKKIGVDTSKMIFSQPNSGEEALNLVEAMVRSKEFGIIVIDSVAALVPQVETEKDMGDSVMGVHARLMSQAMRKLAAPVSKSNTALVFINQTRSKIGVMFGNPETTTGGAALKFYASMRIKMAYTGKIKDTGGFQIASKGRAYIVKNKLAVPHKQADFEIGADGIDTTANLVEKLIASGVIEKKGSWYSFSGEPIGQGIRGVSMVIKKDKELMSKLVESIT